MNPPFVQANTNGRLHAADEPSLSPLNRGFLYGDAIYEVWRTYDGVLFAWEAHWERLLRSATALHLPIPWTPEHILSEIRRTAGAFRDRTGETGELYVRLQVTRGAGPIGLDPGLAEAPDFVILVQPCRKLSEDQLANGLRLSIARELRRNPTDALSPAWKTGNYLNNILCLHEARARGADEVVMLNREGEITEAAVANLGFVRDGKVITPPSETGILQGVTRRLLLESVAPAAGIPFAEAVVRPDDLPAMTECFLMSTTRDLVPVGSIDSVKFATGPETITRRLKQAFADWAAASAREHPDRALGGSD